jgi:hypothetical protein
MSQPDAKVVAVPDREQGELSEQPEHEPLQAVWPVFR